MNPDTSIKKWLLIAGKQYGILEAAHRRLEDPDTRPQSPYCTYKLTNTRQIQVGREGVITKTGHTAHRRTMKKHLTTVEVHLYKSDGGLLVLAAMAVAAEGDGPIRQMLKSEGISFRENLGVEDLTPDDIQGDLTEHYHQRMTCTFEETIGHGLDEKDAVVDTIELQIQTGMSTWEIDAAGYREKT
jgi:hypothetical protein